MVHGVGKIDLYIFNGFENKPPPRNITKKRNKNQPEWCNNCGDVTVQSLRAKRGYSEGKVQKSVFFENSFFVMCSMTWMSVIRIISGSEYYMTLYVDIFRKFSPKSKPDPFKKIIRRI